MGAWAMRRLAWLPLLLAIAAPASHARDLLDVWQMALQRDPIYAASQSARDAVQEKIPQARARLLPYVSATTGANVVDVRRVSGLNDGRTSQRASWALVLTQPIIDIGAWNALEQSRYIAAAADVSRASAYQDLILRVSLAYFNVLAAQDTLRALLAEKSAIETQLRSAQQAFELGGATITDSYEAQARLDLVRAAELAARNNLQVSEDALARLIAERPGPLNELARNVRLPAPEPNRIDLWTEQATQANFGVVQADLATRIAAKQIDIAKSGHYPTLNLQAQTGSASNRGIYSNTGNPDPGPRSLDSTVGLQLSIPIYSGGGVSSQVREQASRLQQARYELENARRIALQSTQQYFSGVTSGLARVDMLQAAEKSSLASLEANRTAFEVGVRVSIDVLNAQQQLYQTQRNLAQARYDTLMDGLRLKAASGILTEQDIAAINTLLVPPAPVAPLAPPSPRARRR